MLSNGVDAVLDDRRVAALLQGPANPLTIEARPGDIARVAYTSGTTGLPKGCAQTYRAMSAHWSWGKRTWSQDTAELAACADRYLLFGTLAGAVVQDYLALCLLGGGTAVIPELDGTPLFPGVIERLRITATIMNVPRLYQMLDDLRAAPTDISSLRAMVVAGSPLTAHRLTAAVQALGPVVHQAYGQTETGGLTTLTPHEIGAGVLTSVGRPLPGVQVDIRDDEIYVRNDYMMSEYLGDPAETADVLVDGWLRTRDLGYLDDDGYLYLTGRARDVIIVDALPVYAGPIERVLSGHPDVDQAYVVGAPDDRRGEAVHAFIVPLTGHSPDSTTLSALVRAELGESSVPQTYTVVADAPIAASGKPDKKALLELYPR
ncbi:ANL family adenylate-forming protein [Nocardia sp. CA-128927]|uniref:ANL family adenylate-forming protein n=1 Tax=Nocardia sp. CA-128927 TaxID=3239975 RepID=UPI003D9635D4